MGSIYDEWDGWVFSEGRGKDDKEWFSLRTTRAFDVDGQEYTYLVKKGSGLWTPVSWFRPWFYQLLAV